MKLIKRSIVLLLVCLYLTDTTRAQIQTSGVGGFHGSAALNAAFCANEFENPLLFRYLGIYFYKKGRDEGEAQGKIEGMDTYVTRKCTPLSNTPAKLADCKACLLTNPANAVSCAKTDCIFQANAQSCTFVG